MPKIVLITGATSGFGKACAEKFASECYDLILNGRREERLEEIKAQLEKQFNVAVFLLPFDVQNREEVFNAIRCIPEDWQGIDVLINNAGLALGRDYFDEANIDDWETMIDTNVKGLLYVSRAILPFMIKHKASTGSAFAETEPVEAGESGHLNPLPLRKSHPAAHTPGCGCTADCGSTF